MRLRELMKENGYTQQSLAEHIGVSRSTVGMWVTGRNEPDNNTLIDLALLFNCSVDYLLGKSDTRVDDGLLNLVNTIPDDILQQYGNVHDALRAMQQSSLPSNVRPLSDLHHQRVPLIGKIAAGQPIMAETDYDTFVDAPIDCDCALEIQGESMVPTYLPGDIIYIKHRQTVNDGQVAVVLIDDEATLKHVYRDAEGLTLISDNPYFPPIRINGREHDYIAIYGVPVGYTRMYKKNKSGNAAK